MRNLTKIILIIILIAICAFSVYKIYDYLKEESANKKLNDELKNKAVVMNTDGLNQNASEEQNNENIVPITVDFNTLKQENKDTVGWIYGADSPINYPVVQGKDNERYVTTLFNGKSNSAGTLFMDYRNDENLSNNNTIIYGHNMKNGTMLGTIMKYRNQSYYDNHKIMYYLTPTKNYKVEIFAGVTSNVYSEIYNLKKINKERANSLMRQSNFKNDVQIGDEDKFLTLSTCAYDFDDARFILIGVLREI